MLQILQRLKKTSVPMIDLYYWPTPNGRKISIMLEECELEYKVIPVDIGAGDQFKPEFLRISPNNRMPAIVDNETGESIFEGGAILIGFTVVILASRRSRANGRSTEPFRKLRARTCAVCS
jgi:hypothetical protein